MQNNSLIRPLTLTRNFLPHPEGSCLVTLGETRVIATATVELTVPPWMKGKGTGWITAEYGMLPRATDVRNRRPVGASVNGRTMEIQRLIGRSLPATVDLKALGERGILIDCDVINADGGTRVASIIGAAVALHDAQSWMLERGIVGRKFIGELVAAVSVGIVGGELQVDLDQQQDCGADVDMNVVMTESGRLVEIQGTAERCRSPATT
jgi:ribonuclease PH